MEAIERVVSYTGLRRRAPTDPPARGWRRVNRFGRYLPETELPAALAAQERTRALAEADGYRTWLWRVCNESVDTEINVELGEFTIKSSRAMLTPVHMGDFDDYRQLFGPMDAARRPQCALVSSSAERQQVLTRTRTLTLTRALALALTLALTLNPTPTLALALALTLTLSLAVALTRRRPWRRSSACRTTPTSPSSTPPPMRPTL